MDLDYTRFQAEDFVLDNSFQAFVAGSDTAAVQFWQSWLEEHPEQRLAAEQAQEIVRVLHQARQPAGDAYRKEQEVQKLRRAIRQPAPAPQLRVQSRYRRFVPVGALLLLLVLGTGYWLWYAPSSSLTRYATAAGQRRTVQLPDGSVVVLNGESQLTTAATWNAETTREVWLEGEAYFQVRHLTKAIKPVIAQAAGNAKFVVHIDELTVSVLGTTFNVINRPGLRNQVTLNEGRVQVEHAGLLRKTQVAMKPGDLVEYIPAQHTVVKRKVEPAYYSAWVQGTLQFNRTPLREIIQLLRDTYGLQVSVDNTALLRQTITGSLPNSNAEVLLKALAKSLGVRMERSGQQVRFQSLN